VGWDIARSVARDGMPSRALAQDGGERRILNRVALACDTLLRLAKSTFCNLLTLIRMASIPPGFERLEKSDSRPECIRFYHGCESYCCRGYQRNAVLSLSRAWPLMPSRLVFPNRLTVYGARPIRHI
jgi:hypothetical protein